MTPLSSLLRPLNFRGKARLLHSLCPQHGERTATLFGYQATLDLKDYIQRSLYLGTFEPEETRMVKDYLRPGMTFVDVGANVGYYSLLAASKGCHVIAFEPSPYASGRLRETVRQNKITSIEIVQAGLAERGGTLNLYIGKSGENHTPTMIPNEDAYAVSVPILKLDDYLTDQNVQRVDLIKIDVEGYEPNVIAGAFRYFDERRVNAVLCELNRHWLEANGCSPERLFQTFIDYGFEVKGRVDFGKANQNLMFTCRNLMP